MACNRWDEELERGYVTIRIPANAGEAAAVSPQNLRIR
jgi:hypothetical protein